MFTNQHVYTADNGLNLDTLLIQIKAAATPMWHQLGEALGIDKESLDRYSSHPPEESIIEMLDQWLRGGPQRRTWRDVADALKKIGLEQLASDIEKVYETGNLTYLVCVSKDYKKHNIGQINDPVTKYISIL